MFTFPKWSTGQQNKIDEVQNLVKLIISDQ